MINLSLEELKAIANLRKVKDYKNKSKDELTKILSEPEAKINIEKIRKRFNDSKSKIKEIRRNLYETENKYNLSTPEIEEIVKNTFEVEKLFEPKNYYDYDDIKYKEI